MSLQPRQQSYASHACIRCASRKVKCDRRLPTCEKCIEATSSCVYVAPPPRRRRRRQVTSDSATARLRQYEELLQAHGISLSVDSSERRPSPPSIPDRIDSHAASTSTRQSETEREDALSATPEMRSSGKTYGGNELWTGLTELTAATDINDTAPTQPLARGDQSLEDNADLLWGVTIQVDIQVYWPQPDMVRELCQIYLTSFHPIYKIVHSPSVLALADRGAETCTILSAAEQALLCAIFANAVYTVTDEDECISRFGESRSQLLSLYRTAARHALGNANYVLTMDLMGLQALFIFLKSLRYDFDSSPLWTLLGIAIRNGKRIGLDRPDEPDQYSPFEMQERRLLWFNLMYFDAYVGEIAGARESWIEFQTDFQTPMNLNDDDIDTDMTEFRPEREGASDVMFTVMRCDWVRGAQKVGLPHLSKGATKTPQEQDRAMDEVEELFARKYVRHCDPTVPMQFWLLLTARSMMVEMRLSLYLRRQQNAGSGTVSSESSDTLFNLSLKALEYEYMGQTAESLHVFRWHMSDQIPRVSITWLVAELRTHTVGPAVDKAWTQIEATFSKHPELITHTQRPWIGQLGSMVLKAWEHREKGRLENGLKALAIPQFVTELRNRRSGLVGEGSAKDMGMGDSSGFGAVFDPMDTASVAYLADLGSFDGEVSGTDGGTFTANLTVEQGASFDFGGSIDWSQWGISMAGLT